MKKHLGAGKWGEEEGQEDRDVKRASPWEGHGPEICGVPILQRLQEGQGQRHIVTLYAAKLTKTQNVNKNRFLQLMFSSPEI